jgi:glycosyltransferase involved in cell wall biosynthesis
VTNVLIITALYPPAVGGAATYFGEVAPRLAQCDAIDRLTILTERMPAQPRERIDGKLRLLRYLPTRVSGPRRPWLVHAATYVLTQAWFAVRLPGLVRQLDIDFIHFHTRYRGQLFYNALKRSGVPMIADLRDKMTDPAQLVDVADRLLCCGEGVQRFAVEGGFPPERAALIPIPFTPPEIPSPAQVSAVKQRYHLNDGPYLLFLGDITYNKGVYELMEAYRRWRRDHPRVQLVYAGTNREGDRFTERVAQMRGVHYLGRVPHQDALALMRGAEIVVLPSRSEGLPRVILEAVAMGTKVIGPPDIPEFERNLQEFTLQKAEPDAIVRKLDVVWQADQYPSYDFTNHRMKKIVDGLVDTYRKVEPHR